jgi:hypothetical protein
VKKAAKKAMKKTGARKTVPAGSTAPTLVAV